MKRDGLFGDKKWTAEQEKYIQKHHAAIEQLAQEQKERTQNRKDSLKLYTPGQKGRQSQHGKTQRNFRRK